MEEKLPSPSLALAAYAEAFLSGRRVVVFGDSLSGLAEHLVDRGARLVQVYDLQSERVAEATACNTSRHVSFGLLNQAGVPSRDGAFDLGIIDDVASMPDARRAVALLRQVLSARGVAFVVSPNPDLQPRFGHPQVSGASSYYDLYDLVSAEFDEVRMLGQAPFVGFALADFSPDSEDEFSVDTSMVPGGAEEAEWYVAVASHFPVACDPFSVVQLPAAQLLQQVNSPRRLRDELRAAKRQVEHLEQQLAAAQEVPSAPPQPERESQERLNEAQERLRESQARLSEAQERLRESQARLSEANLELERRDAWVKELEARAAIADARADEAEARADEAQEQAAQAVARAKHTERRAQELDALRRQLAQAREALQRAHGELEQQRLQQAEQQRLQQAEQQRLQQAEQQRLQQAEQQRLQQAEQQRLQQAEQQRLQQAEQQRLQQAEQQRLQQAEQQRLQQAEQQAQRPSSEDEDLDRRRELATLRERAKRLTEQLAQQRDQNQALGHDLKAQATEVLALEKQLVDRGKQVRELTRALTVTERFAEQVLRELDDARGEQDVASEQDASKHDDASAQDVASEQDASKHDDASAQDASTAATPSDSMEARLRKLESQLDALAQTDAQRVADLTAARWTIAELENKLVGQEALDTSETERELELARAQLQHQATLLKQYTEKTRA